MNIISFDEINSTNTYIKDNYKKLDDFTVVTANKQTVGRGRLGKSFYSPKSGLYFSILIKDKEKLKKLKHFTVIAAVAVMNTLKTYTAKSVSIKWVNDIYIEDKKVCGILSESSKDYAVIGIGINLYNKKADIPTELKGIMGFLFENEIDSDTKREILISIVNSINSLLETDECKYINEYKNNSYLDDKDVYLLKGDTCYPVKVLGIDNNCRLVVKTKDNRIETLFTGEVSIKI